jgi:hypothetical protein
LTSAGWQWPSAFTAIPEVKSKGNVGRSVA